MSVYNVSIVIIYRGALADEVERYITIPVETAFVEKCDSIERVTSSSCEERAKLQVSVSSQRSLHHAIHSVSRCVDDVLPQLPYGIEFSINPTLAPTLDMTHQTPINVMKEGLL